MVQYFLSSGLVRNLRAAVMWVFVLALLVPSLEAYKRKETPAQPAPPDLLLEGGRKLTYERSFSSEREVRKKPGFFGKILNVIAGEPDMHAMIRPGSIAV